MEDIEIREASADDVIGIVYVQATSWIASYQSAEHGITEADIRSLNFHPKVAEWQHVLRSPNYKVWVAKQGDDVLSFIAARQNSINEIHEQHTLPANQRQGWGTKLFNEVLKWLGEQKAIWLRIPSYSQSGIAFYRKQGFVVDEEGAVDFIRLPSGKQIPTIVLRRAGQLESPAAKPPEATIAQPQPTQAAAPEPQAPSASTAKTQALVSRAKLAQLSGVRPSTIKYYSEIGILSFQQEDTRLARRYEVDTSLERLRQIKDWQNQGMTIGQIKQKLSNP
ncbi:GNAT family N-acetyltransferase [Candidatus Microgenomates bacterium]|nr:GNAT family N-acetyltransferase [Candidatus Microgenomates bacterium]